MNRFDGSKITAVFGGSFNPPHVGHREAVEGLFRQPGVKQVVILPTGQSPLKGPMSDPARRLNWVHATWPKHLAPQVCVDELEVYESLKDPSHPQYSFESLQKLQPRYGEVAMVIGTDQLLSLPRWHRFPELLRVCHWVVLLRKGADLAAVHRTLNEWCERGWIRPQNDQEWSIEGSPIGTGTSRFLTLAPTEARELSSTQIREHWAKTGKIDPEWVVPEVLSDLMAQPFYGSGSRPAETVWNK